MTLELAMEGELTHAYGIPGQFAAVFPQLCLLLEKNCKEILRGNPDAYVREMDSLSIEDAREVRDFAALTNRGKGRKLVVLSFIDATRHAQNALLKTLEEPNPGVHFFIITPVIDTLLPTLRSRLTLISGTVSDTYREEARTFLKTPMQKRITLLKPFLGEEKDRTGALSFVAALLREIRGETGKPLSPQSAESLATLERAVRDLRLTGASVKGVLEHVALTI